jgi:hypothetical protein
MFKAQSIILINLHFTVNDRMFSFGLRRHIDANECEREKEKTDEIFCEQSIEYLLLLLLLFQMILLRLLWMIYVTDGLFLFFERNSYEFFVSESIPIPTRVGLIRATASSSLDIEYELHGNPNRTFSYDSLTNELYLIQPLDYETISIHKLTLEVRSTSNIAPSFTELIVHVLNTNDNPPEINLILYPSIVMESTNLFYDLNSYSTPLATISIKDLDQSTNNLTLLINDTEHFQIQFVRQIRHGSIVEAIYLLSTKNNTRLIERNDYVLSLNTCDNDQPRLWTNRSYEFHLKSTEQFCSLLFNDNKTMIDIQEHLPNRTLILRTRTNKYCPIRFYSIDDTKHFYVDSQTGDLYTSTRFNRREQSIYRIHLQLNEQFKQELLVRILDEHQHRPFLMRKTFQIDRDRFTSIDLMNATLCRSQTMIYRSFELLANCTLRKLFTPIQGKYIFYIQLNDTNNYEDTFLLELTSSSRSTQYIFTLLQSSWIVVVVMGIMLAAVMILIVCILCMARKHKSRLTKQVLSFEICQFSF